MSLTDLAAALVGLRETTYKDHQRLLAAADELRAAIDEVLDRRLGQTAQSIHEVERRLDELADRRLTGLFRTMVEVVGRLDELAAAEPAGAEELCRRLASLAEPRDRLRERLEEAGVVRMTTLGQLYQPLYHEAVRREHRDDCIVEHVVEEVRPGWLIAGSDQALLRARVVVAAPPVRRAEPAADE